MFYQGVEECGGAFFEAFVSVRLKPGERVLGNVA